MSADGLGVDLDELRSALRAGIADLAERFLGPPNKGSRNRRELRWGKKGSFCIHVSGPKQGACVNFEDGWKGDPLGLIMRELHCDFRGAVEYGCAFAGIAFNGEARQEDPAERAAREAAEEARKAERDRKRAERDAQQEADEGKRIAYARQLWAASVPVEGTIAEVYLNTTRCIPTPPGGWPDAAVRFHRGSRSLIVALTNADGAVQAVQRVHLTPDAQKIDQEEAELRGLPNAKSTNGLMAGAAVRLPGPADDPLLLAEGPETGLSLWAATGYETRLSIGPIPNHAPPTGRVVVVCRDDDPRGSNSDKGLRRAVAGWRKAHIDVVVATPWAIGRGDKTDFNDLAKAGGLDAVRARIAFTLSPTPSDGAPNRVPVREAQHTLDQLTRSFFNEAAAWGNRRQAEFDKAKPIVAQAAWNEAPPEVRAFRDARDSVRSERDVARDSVTQAKRALDAALAELKQARAALAFAKGRTAKDAARAERDRLHEVWKERRVALQAAKDAATEARDKHCKVAGKGADEAPRLKAEAAKINSKIKREAFARAAHAVGPPPVHALRVDTGAGKSHEARIGAADHLIALRKAGDTTTGLYVVPTIALADQQAKLFNDLPQVKEAGLAAAVWRGMERPDPDAPGFDDPTIPESQKIKMCLDLDAVSDAREALADVQTKVCQQRNPDGTIKSSCAFFDQCGTQRQKKQRPDLTFAAHEMIYERLPAAMGAVGFLIADETAWQDGLIGADGNVPTLSLDTLSRHDNIPNAPLESQRLRSLRALVVDALVRLPHGPIPRATIQATGLTAQSAAEARALEWRRKLDADIWPGMPAHLRKEAVKQVAVNKTISRLSMFWSAIENLLGEDGPEKSGWAAIGQKKTRDGIINVVELKGRKPTADSLQVPTLILDATLQPEPLRPFWPALEVKADIAIQAPHQRIIQVDDRSFSKAQLDRPRNFRDTRAILFRIARQYAPGRVLGVIQQEFEEQLIAKGHIPANLELAHHNAVAGKDGWGPGPGRAGVAAVVVIGRTAPGPQAMEQRAEALTGVAIPRTANGQWYPRGDAVRELADGSFRLAQSDRHTVPIVEDCRWQVSEAEVIQIIGRARGVNRTAANPVDVFVLTDVPLPLPVNHLISADDLEPTLEDLMMAEGGVAFTSPTHAARAYPDVWTPDAAKWAKARSEAGFQTGTNEERSVTFSDRESLLVNVTDLGGIVPLWNSRDFPGLKTANYQLSGAGQSPTAVTFDPAIVPDIAVLLADRVGDLAWCRVDDVAAADAPAAKPQNVIAAMAAEGLVLSNPRHAFMMFPKIFASPESARKALQRVGDVALSPDLVSDDAWARVEYQLAGARQHPAAAYANDARVVGLKTELAMKLGPLARFDVMPMAAQAQSAQPAAEAPPAPTAEPASEPVSEEQPVAQLQPDAPPAPTPANAPLPVETWTPPEDPALEEARAALAAMGVEGLALLNPDHAFVVFDGMFTSCDAAREALQRAGDVPLSPAIVSDDHWAYRVDYRVAGARQRPAVAYASGARVISLRVELTQRLGTLASFCVSQMGAAAPEQQQTAQPTPEAPHVPVPAPTPEPAADPANDDAELRRKHCAVATSVGVTHGLITTTHPWPSGLGNGAIAGASRCAAMEADGEGVTLKEPMTKLTHDSVVASP